MQVFVKDVQIYFELQAMHSSHMQSEALKGYLGFCIRHLVKSFIWMLHHSIEWDRGSRVQ
ncbi:hypothetical protein T4E_9597 [Trichinella pseudospiralis]|uniref:Uncharacterized protein n=1 Tax=Trichinella pseudospiralis TaxID=6337 RepID=A0A0V0YDD5_TRIPS|nr:hypothetical protein T4E_9597 [Trichinella pseudospiralis]